MEQDSSNLLFQLAGDLVKNTSRHIFLTGKAGTGKTTFLRYIKDNSFKKAVVVAPTGVAAINAGGVTIHSLFQLPLGPFVPGNKPGFSGDSVTDKHSLLATLKLGTEKRKLLQELELLIIDEVSMVRCDTLDAIDLVLRHFRKQWDIPFGGVQVLYIGDLYQLPPVVPDLEWEILRNFYSSPFFFDSLAFAQSSALYIELDKVYRQTDQSFIDLLNRIRNNVSVPDDWRLLNRLHDPDFIPSAEENYITLTTHNNRADAINSYKLRQLPGEAFTFKGSIDREFPDRALPTDLHLQLKIGAQVMFVRNDTVNDIKRYYNGKLGVVKYIKGDIITISFPNEPEDLELKKEEWKNIRYNYDKESGRINEEELGSFTQYPIRLAWAITIHKSQGLTFERAIIDAGETFAPGQLYTALSRCTSMDGMVLYSTLSPSNVLTDFRIVEFAKKAAKSDELQTLLNIERQNFWAERIVQLFDFNKLLDPVEEYETLVAQTKLPDRNEAKRIAARLIEICNANQEVARKFAKSLKPLLLTAIETNDYSFIQERIGKAVEYFTRTFQTECIIPLDEHIRSLEYAIGVKGYLTQTRGLALEILQIINTLQTIKFGDKVIYQAPVANTVISALYAKPKRPKQAKGYSNKVSYKLFREGKTIEVIAKLRNITPSTVQTHLAELVTTGEIDIYELVSKERLPVILDVIDKVDTSANLTLIKELLDSSYTYGEIKAALNFRNRIDHKPA